MSKTHWKKFQNPDYIGAYAFDEGEEKVVTIDRCQKEHYTGSGGKKDEGLVAHFLEKEKPMILNATNSKRIEKIAGSAYIEDWHGVKIQLYTEMVTAFGETGLAVRVRTFPPKTDEYKCVDCGAEIKGFKEYTSRQMAEQAKSKYGRYLCMECAKKAKEAKEEDAKKGDVLSDENNESQD